MSDPIAVGVPYRSMWTRRSLVLLGATLLAPLAVCAQSPAQERLKVLAVVAHPDDEYAFAATVYRITQQLGGVVDQVVISNGEAGYRYSVLAEQIYGLHLTEEQVGRSNLPEIRKEETLAAGRILGIRQHHFLDQKDAGFTLDPESVKDVWDIPAVRTSVAKLLREENYDFVLTLLPTSDTHGHHKAATILALEAAASLPEPRRPVVFGVEPESSHEPGRKFIELSGHSLTRVGTDEYEFRRTQPLGFHDALNYEIIANWVIAAHKSQGLFQMDTGRHDIERFWRFEASGPGSKEPAERLFKRLNPASAAALHPVAGDRP